jgi:hypothetical protein
LIARIVTTVVWLGTLPSTAVAAHLRPQTVAEFDGYVARAELQMRNGQSSPESFLASLGTGARRTELESRLRRSEVLVEKRNATPTEISGGLIHHWIGITFVPNVTIAQVFSVLQDYGQMARYYSPEVESSQLISRRGDDFHIYMRLRKHKVITVVLGTEYDVHYARLDSAHQFSISRSTRVVEIANPGERNEYIEAEGDGHGFMWRLNSYWRFQQAPDGVFVECEAISLTRDMPTGLGWLVGPFIQDIPRESLQFTLNATRNAVLRNGQFKSRDK